MRAAMLACCAAFLSGCSTAADAPTPVPLPPSTGAGAFLEKEGDRIVLRLKNGPAWLHALDSRPAQWEPTVRQGKWVVVNFAVWSGTDIGLLETAVSAVEPYGSAVNLGLRPYAEASDLYIVFPDFDQRRGSFTWQLLENGQVIDSIYGYDASAVQAALRRWDVSSTQRQPLRDDDGL